MDSYTIVVATTNQGKIKEIYGILRAVTRLNLHIKSLRDFVITEPDEPYDSFMQNAAHKAKYYANITQLPTLSEDAGLCIEALNDFPGVRTKEFTEECGNIQQAFKLIENMLQNFSNKRAYFNCAAALYIPQQTVLITHEARDYGVITFPPRGADGFGYDPVFIPEGYKHTMAELGLTVKNQISHRAKAIRGIAEQLAQISS